MVPRVQRLGGGPSGVAAACWRASSPGPCCKRSWISWRSSWSWLKRPPTVATVLVSEEAGQPFVLVIGEPGVNRVGVAVTEEGSVGHSIRGLSVSNLEQGGTALTNRGLGVVIAMVEQCGAFVVRKRQSTALAHGEVSSLVPIPLIRTSYRTCSSKFIRWAATPAAIP